METSQGCCRKKRGRERRSDEIDVVCKIILFKVIERECQESKSESLLDDGRKTKTKWKGTDEVLYLDIHHQETI